MTEIERLREALEWALPLASIALESHRLERLRCGHDDIRFTRKDGTPGVGLWQEEYEAQEKARAALSSTPPVGEWQDMESAPHDGTKIDLLYPYPRGRTVDCYWDDGIIKGWCWRSPVWERGELLPESEWDWGSYPNATPLGWMPAPPSPRETEGQG